MRRSVGLEPDASLSVRAGKDGAAVSRPLLPKRWKFVCNIKVLHGMPAGRISGFPVAAFYLRGHGGSWPGHDHRYRRCTAAGELGCQQAHADGSSPRKPRSACQGAGAARQGRLRGVRAVGCRLPELGVGPSRLASRRPEPPGARDHAGARQAFEHARFLNGIEVAKDEVNIASALISAHEYEEALSAARRARTIAPFLVSPHICILSIYNRTGRREDVARTIADLMANNPGVIDDPDFLERVTNDTDLIGVGEIVTKLKDQPA